MTTEAENIIRLGGILAYGNGGGMENPVVALLIAAISLCAFVLTQGVF